MFTQIEFSVKIKCLSVADASDYKKLKKKSSSSVKNTSMYNAQLTLYKHFEEHFMNFFKSIDINLNKFTHKNL